MFSGKRHTAGEVGCVLSHQLAYQQLLDSSENACLIMEDDVDLSGASMNLIQECISLEALNQNKPCMLILHPIKQFFRQGTIMLSDTKHRVVKSFRGLGTHSYIINREAACFLLSLNETIQHVADPWNLIQLLYPRTFDFYAIQKPIMLPDPIHNPQSDIDRVKSRKKMKCYTIYHLFYGILRIRLLLNEWWCRAIRCVVKIPKAQRRDYSWCRKQTNA